MVSLINQYSALIGLIILGTAVFAVIWRRRPPEQRRALLPLGLLLLLGVAFLLFRPQAGGVGGATVEMVLLEGNGGPVLVEMYSDY